MAEESEELDRALSVYSFDSWSSSILIPKRQGRPSALGGVWF